MKRIYKNILNSIHQLFCVHIWARTYYKYWDSPANMWEQHFKCIRCSRMKCEYTESE